MVAIYAHQITREYAPNRGIREFTLSLEVGACFALLGSNGSGKSTLTRLLLGLEKPEAGVVEVLGRAPAQFTTADRRRLGVVLDEDRHWQGLSGYDNAYFFARSYGLSHKEAVARVREFFDLSGLGAQADEPVSIWSFGMKRKLTIIEALLHAPDLLVLDEPTVGVDAQFLHALAVMIKKRQSDGKTTWIVGNDAEWYATVASRVGLLQAGSLLCSGSVKELISRLAPWQELKIELADHSLLPQLTMAGVEHFRQEGSTIKAILHNDSSLLPEVVKAVIAGGGSIRSLELSKGTLRDALLLAKAGVLT